MLKSGELKELEDRIVSRIEIAIESLFATRPAPVVGPAPGLLKKKEAAKALGVGLTKLEGLVRRGEIHTTRVGDRELVPHSEIVRLSRPDERKSGSGHRRSPKRYDAREEAEKIRAALRKKKV